MAALRHDLDLDRYERALREQGFARIAGVDEAGRGALAGPLVAAAVILPEGFDREGIDDSKLLTAQPARGLLRADRRERRVVAVCKAEPAAIDGRGLHRSNLALLRRARTAPSARARLRAHRRVPGPRMGFPSLSIKKGDAVTASVAAASIVAKVTRDRIMDGVCTAATPSSGSTTTGGTGRPSTWRRSNALGPTPIHRLSFAGVGQSSLPGMGRGDVATA